MIFCTKRCTSCAWKISQRPSRWPKRNVLSKGSAAAMTSTTRGDGPGALPRSSRRGWWLPSTWQKSCKVAVLISEYLLGIRLTFVLGETVATPRICQRSPWSNLTDPHSFSEHPTPWSHPPKALHDDVPCETPGQWQHGRFLLHGHRNGHQRHDPPVSTPDFNIPWLRIRGATIVLRWLCH